MESKTRKSRVGLQSILNGVPEVGQDGRAVPFLVQSWTGSAQGGLVFVQRLTSIPWEISVDGRVSLDIFPERRSAVV